MNDAAQFLSRAIVGLEANRLPVDVRRRLLAGLLAFRDGRGDLEACLGLKGGVGKPGVPRQYRLAQRDDLLRRMADQLPDEGPWGKSRRIARIIQHAHFDHSGTIGDLLDELIDLDIDLPTSRVQLHRIISGDRSA